MLDAAHCNWNGNNRELNPMFILTLTERECKKRMHSSRMRTGRSLTVCWSLLPGGCLVRVGGLLPPGGVCLLGGGCGPGGVSASGGVLVLGGLVPGRGVWSWGAVCLPGGSACGGVCLLGGSPCRGVYLPQTPPLLTESQTPVKTLPWPNFVAAGKYSFIIGTSQHITKRIYFPIRFHSV